VPGTLSFGTKNIWRCARAATVCLAILGATLAQSVELSAQSSTSAADSGRSAARADSATRCDSILSANRLDSVRVSVRGQLLRTDGGVLPTNFRTLLTQEIMIRLVLPRPLAVPTFAPGPVRLRMLRPERALSGDRTASLREPEIYGVYRFRLSRTGSVDSVSIAIPSIAPGLDSAVIMALRVASAERTMPMFLDVLTEDTLHLQLRITSGPEEPRLRGSSQVLFQSMFPRLLVTDAVAHAGSPAAPFPDEEQTTGSDGDVLIRGVIDVDGTPLVPTLEVVHATSRAFALSALRTIVRWRFVPARVGTCPVQQVVFVPFWFSLRP
jgi:hypothetical protein